MKDRSRSLLSERKPFNVNVLYWNHVEQNAIGFVSRLILVNMEKKADAKSRSNRMLTKFLSRNRFTFLKFSTYAVDSALAF